MSPKREALSPKLRQCREVESPKPQIRNPESRNPEALSRNPQATSGLDAVSGGDPKHAEATMRSESWKRGAWNVKLMGLTVWGGSFEGSFKVGLTGFLVVSVPGMLLTLDAAFRLQLFEGRV